MLAWLLDAVYGLVLIAASPWLVVRSWRDGKYREGWLAKFLGRVPERSGQRPCVWLHAVSLGEVNLLGVLLQSLAKHRPDVECYITTTTRTGYEAACRRYPQCQVAYCPLDFSWAVREAVRRIRPDLLVLAELELWPQLIGQVRRSGASVAIVNGRLSPRSFRGYRRFRWFFRPVLARVDRVLAQTQEYADRFMALGADPRCVVVTGSLKYDGAQMDRGNRRTRELVEWMGICRPQRVWVAGSTFDTEEGLVLDVFRRLAGDFPELRLVIVPRHPERFDGVAEQLEASGWSWVRRSRATLAEASQARVLLVDTVGELSAWWGLADVGFVGGSLSSRGGQNMIEPAAYGVPLCFGPNTVNFRDVVERMLAVGGAVVVQDGESMERFVRRTLEDSTTAAALGERARQLVQQNQGATERSWQQLLPLIPHSLDAPCGSQASSSRPGSARFEAGRSSDAA